jgi:hypothetical protein
MLPQVRLKRLPRMLTSRSGPQPARAPFDRWAPSKPRIRTTGATVENIVDADPVAALVREMMADRAQWTGSASDLLLAGTRAAGNPMRASSSGKEW